MSGNDRAVARPTRLTALVIEQFQVFRWATYNTFQPAEPKQLDIPNIHRHLHIRC